MNIRSLRKYLKHHPDFFKLYTTPKNAVNADIPQTPQISSKEYVIQNKSLKEMRHHDMGLIGLIAFLLNECNKFLEGAEPQQSTLYFLWQQNVVESQSETYHAFMHKLQQAQEALATAYHAYQTYYLTDDSEKFKALDKEELAERGFELEKLFYLVRGNKENITQYSGSTLDAILGGLSLPERYNQIAPIVPQIRALTKEGNYNNFLEVHFWYFQQVEQSKLEESHTGLLEMVTQLEKTIIIQKENFSKLENQINHILEECHHTFHQAAFPLELNRETFLSIFSVYGRQILTQKDINKWTILVHNYQQDPHFLIGWLKHYEHYKMLAQEIKQILFTILKKTPQDDWNELTDTLNQIITLNESFEGFIDMFKIKYEGIKARHHYLKAYASQYQTHWQTYENLAQNFELCKKTLFAIQNNFSQEDIQPIQNEMYKAEYWIKEIETFWQQTASALFTEEWAIEKPEYLMQLETIRPKIEAFSNIQLQFQTQTLALQTVEKDAQTWITKAQTTLNYAQLDDYLKAYHRTEMEQLQEAIHQAKTAQSKRYFFEALTTAQKTFEIVETILQKKP
jgi:hypothetical protein